MNRELLQKIYFEAVSWCEENAVGTPIAWEFEEKFAELIIRDCEQALRREGEMGKIQLVAGPSGAYKLSFMNSAANLIKERFGVK